MLWREGAGDASSPDRQTGVSGWVRFHRPFKGQCFLSFFHSFYEYEKISVRFYEHTWFLFDACPSSYARLAYLAVEECPVCFFLQGKKVSGNHNNPTEMSHYS